MMRSQHLPMPWEAFELMPRQPGWKYEYWDGQAHISPRHQVVIVTVTVQPCAGSAPCWLRTVTQDDAPGLAASYIAAFSDTIEYCDWQPEQVKSSAHANIRNFFAGKRGQPHPASHVAVVSQSDTPGEQIAGAALIIGDDSEPPLLDMLFVAPAWQRQGLATALVTAALNALHSAGVATLQSSYMLGNVESQAWHQRFGFVEEPDLFLAQAYYRHSKYELWRRETIGDLTDAERALLSAEVERWHKRVEALQAIADQQGITAVSPLLRRRFRNHTES
jgi:GNAT superfamily N-acetyltransferase